MSNTKSQDCMKDFSLLKKMKWFFPAQLFMWLFSYHGCCGRGPAGSGDGAGWKGSAGAAAGPMSPVPAWQCRGRLCISVWYWKPLHKVHLLWVLGCRRPKSLVQTSPFAMPGCCLGHSHSSSQDILKVKTHYLALPELCLQPKSVLFGNFLIIYKFITEINYLFYKRCAA